MLARAYEPACCPKKIEYLYQYKDSNTCSSDSEQLIKLSHVYISVFLCVLIVVLVVHADAYMDSGLLILVLAQPVCCIHITQIPLLLSLFIIVDDLKLDRWLRFIE